MGNNNAYYLRQKLKTMQTKKGNGLRQLIIYGLTREQQINFIKRKDSSSHSDNLARLTDKQVRETALRIDKQVQADRQKKKNNGGQ